MLSEINNTSRRQIFLTGSLLLSSVLGLWLLPHYLAVEKPRTFHVAESTNATTLICTPAAPFLSPQDLLDHQIYSEIDHVAGVPKLIHQSWIDRDLPIKFKQWSDSFRLKHPEWKWVLWTDDDNARLVARLPELEPTYRALRNGIQRADFVRNLYMWEFGGLYADLDMECLRPFDQLLAHPESYSFASTKAHRPRHGSASRRAFVGSMESYPGRWEEHGLPNAFMASVPRHPLWLYPIARVLSTYQVRSSIDSPVAPESAKDAEDITGPVALSRSLETYRAEQAESLPLDAVLPPILHSMVRRTEQAGDPEVDEVVVFDAGVIYPFSWIALEVGIERDTHCRAAPGTGFDPARCLQTTRAYERGAHSITYWSHSWLQDSDNKDLSIVGLD